MEHLWGGGYFKRRGKMNLKGGVGVKGMDKELELICVCNAQYIPLPQEQQYIPEQGEEEGEGFPTAGLGNAHDIPPRHTH